MVVYEKDPKTTKMQADVFAKIGDVMSQYEPNTPEKDKNNLAFVSVEDALKELLELGVDIR